MKNFIFLSQEGLTKAPNGTDIENLQVLGMEKGANKEEAFKNFIKENKYLIQMNFNEIIAIELANEKQYYFSLKSYN